MKLARLQKNAHIEPYWHVQLAVLLAIGLELLLSSQLTVISKYIVALGELGLLIALSVFSRQQGLLRLRRGLAMVLIAVISAANISSLLLIVGELLSASAHNGRELLVSGLAIYLTNIIMFGLWYWELDSANDAGTDGRPDFMFAQSNQATSKWRPTFFDYLYVSTTNASAFSPTDTLPLTHRAKALMTLQALTALLTVALVAARAVNILA